jgi:transcriptional regulator with XRE-family HTH domain
MTSDVPQADVLQLAWPESTLVADNQSTSIVEEADAKLVSRMPGKERRDAPSTQLMRFRALILQMEKGGHPNWRDEHGLPLEKVTQAELSRRTGLTSSYLNSIKYPDRSRNTDIGAAKVAQLCDRVGLDVRYFYDGYEGERPYVIYLLDRKREQNQADATEKAIADLRSEFRGALDAFRSDVSHREQDQAAQIASLERQLEEANQRLQATGTGAVRRVRPVVDRGPGTKKRR